MSSQYPQSPTAKKAAAATRAGGDVRERVRSLTVGALKDRNLKLRDLPGLASEVMDGAVEGIKSVVPRDQESVLRQVVEGLGDAYDAAARSARNAAKDVRKRGSDVVQKGVKPATRDLSKIRDELFDTVGKFRHRLSDELSDDFRAIMTRARRAGRSVSPGIRSAAGAADGKVVKLSGEVASAGAKAARQAAGSVMLAASGLLEGFADAIKLRPSAAGTAKKSSKKKPARRSAKKASKKK
jgi:hypothetical protein